MLKATLHSPFVQDHRRSVSFHTPLGKHHQRPSTLSAMGFLAPCPGASPYASPNPVWDGSTERGNMEEGTSSRRSSICTVVQSSASPCVRRPAHANRLHSLDASRRPPYTPTNIVAVPIPSTATQTLTAAALIGGVFRRAESGFGSLSPAAAASLRRSLSQGFSLACSPIGTMAAQIALLSSFRPSQPQQEGHLEEHSGMSNGVKAGAIPCVASDGSPKMLRKAPSLRIHSFTSPAEQGQIPALTQPSPSSPIRRKGTMHVGCGISPQQLMRPRDGTSIPKAQSGSPTGGRARPPRRHTASQAGHGPSPSRLRRLTLSEVTEVQHISDFNLTYTARRSAVISRLTYDDEEDAAVTLSISGGSTRQPSAEAAQQEVSATSNTCGSMAAPLTHLISSDAVDEPIPLHFATGPESGNRKGVHREQGCPSCSVM